MNISSKFSWLFPGSSAGKVSACNAGDLDLIPGSGRFPGEGIGYPLQYSWASLVAQTVKNPPAMWETWVWSLCWEDPLEEGMDTHSRILAWRIPMDRGAWQAIVHGVSELDITEWLSTAWYIVLFNSRIYFWFLLRFSNSLLIFPFCSYIIFLNSSVSSFSSLSKFFWSCHVAFGILLPWPGVERGPLQWKCQVLTIGPPGNSLFEHL